MSRQPDLGPGPGPIHGSTMFKQETAPLSTDPHQHHSHQRAQAPPSSHVLHRPRAPSSGIHVHASQQSPRQPPPLQPSQHQAPFPSPHASTHALPPQHPSSFGHAGQTSAGAHAQDIPYFATQPSPYSTSSASGTYSSAETPELMAPAHINRSYPPIYHTPQSNSPASVSSPSGHEPHGRSLYGQPTPPQIPQSMYSYSQTYPSMTSYGHAGAVGGGGGGGGGGGSGGGGPSHTSVLNPQPPPLMMPSQPMSTSVPTPQTSSGHAHPHALSSMSGSRRSSPTQPSLQRPGPPPPSGTAAPTTPHTPHSATGPGAMLGLPGSAGPPGTTGSNPSAAPGPIPATTPLVVRQDHNGVQWIAFEYSRDRVKMEYQIRCDVESVDVDKLSQEFKTDNCVYPRACCSKEQYRGNRLLYETECNTVGWALAELNPPLRGKRGLIQRAVDSWRNSNQDPRLRSRRVRRIHKAGTRRTGHAPQQQLQLQQQQPHQQEHQQHHQQHHPQQQDRLHQLLHQQHQQPQHAGQMGPPGSSASSGHPTAIGSAGVKSSPRGLPGPQLHHHHHAQPEGAAVSAAEDLSAGTAYDGHHQHHHHQAPNGSASTAASSSTGADPRQRQIFHPFPPHYPSDAGVGVPGLPPSGYGAMTPMGARKPSGAAAAASSSSTPRTSERNVELFGEIPEGRRRKFILVEDPHRGGMRVRVRVTLDQVEMKEIPDSYRKGNSVFPRSYFPMQMQSPRPHRFPEDEDGDDDLDGDGGADGRGRDNHVKPGRGRTLVPVPTLDGTEAEVPTPRMTRTKRKKEAALNDLGYRMSWSQSRVFAGRTIFLQRALDAYRNKMRSTMMATGQDASQIAPHFETRVGKRRWKERARRSGRQSTP